MKKYTLNLLLPIVLSITPLHASNTMRPLSFEPGTPEFSHEQKIIEAIKTISCPQLIQRIHRYQNLVPTTNGTMTITPFRIPPISHHIWFTRENSPKEISNDDLENLRNIMATINADAREPWQHILWVNDPSLIPSSVQQLIGSGMEIRDLRDYSTQLETLPLALILLYDTSLNGMIGAAVDLIRYDILTTFGGWYADLNYVIHRSPESLMRTFDFFVDSPTQSLSLAIENFMIASIPGHPILDETISEIIPLLTSPTLRDAIKYESSTLADEVTTGVFSQICLMQMNIYTTRDLILSCQDSNGLDERGYEELHHMTVGTDTSEIDPNSPSTDFDKRKATFILEMLAYEKAFGKCYPGQFGKDGKKMGRSWSEENKVSCLSFSYCLPGLPNPIFKYVESFCSIQENLKNKVRESFSIQGLEESDPQAQEILARFERGEDLKDCTGSFSILKSENGNEIIFYFSLVDLEKKYSKTCNPFLLTKSEPTCPQY